MKKLLVIFLVFILPRNTFASHAMGAEIYYETLGNNQYLVNFIFYRDCSGINAPSTIQLNATWSTGISSFVLNPIPGSPFILHTTCPGISTTCNAGTYVGVEKWIYSGVITLTVSELVTIYHSENARNSSLTTIAGAGSDDLFVYGVINNSQNITNHSPVFNFNPEIVVCQGTLNCVPSFVTDADGDSLVFELITPRRGPTIADTVQFLTGFSAQQPFTSSPPLALDAATGEICFTPMAANEVSLRAMLVSEYRNGVLLGQVERDMQTQVIPCTNVLPVLSGFNGAPTFNLNVCAGQQNCFFLASSDADAVQTSFANWDLTIPGALTTHTLGHRDTMYVCWAPSDSDTIANPHCFVATVIDDNCPYPGIRFFEYCLNVIPSQICNPTSVKENNEAYSAFSVYPQPASDRLNLIVDQNLIGYTVTLYSSIGKKLRTFIIADKNTFIDVGEIPAGTYSAVISDSNNRIIKSKPVILIK